MNYSNTLFICLICLGSLVEPSAQSQSIHGYANFHVFSHPYPFHHDRLYSPATEFAGPSIAFRKSELKSYHQLEMGFNAQERSSEMTSYNAFWIWSSYEVGLLAWQNHNKQLQFFMGGYFGAYYFYGDYEKYKDRDSEPREIIRAGVNFGWNAKLQYFLSPILSVEVNISPVHIVFLGDKETSFNEALPESARERAGFDLNAELLGPSRIGIGYHF